MAIIKISGVPHAYDLTPSSPNPSLPVLVFVHGWLLSRRYWQPLVEQLSNSYQCLVYDLRGFGESQCFGASNKQVPVKLSEEKNTSPSCYSLAAYAQDLGTLLNTLDIKRAWLIGHSLGGSIALWAADLFPNQINGIICLNSGGGIYLKEEFERFRAFGKRLVKLRPRWLSYIPLIELLFTRAMVAHPVARRWARQRLIDFIEAHPEAALGALLDSTTEEEVNLLPQLVSRLEQPVYFLAGAQDQTMEPKYVCHLASFHSLFQEYGHNFLEIPECGHLSMIEQPDAVVSHITRILMNN